MKKCLLSIITVTKDCAATLEQTIRSVGAIKTDEIEYLIVDGVSTDGTLELVAKYGDLIDRVVSEPDTGIYNAMNKGVGLAQGDYILFINGDDELVPDGFAEVLERLRSGQTPIVCATTLVGDPSSPAEVLVAETWKLPFFNSIPHPSCFVAASLLQNHPFREDLRIASDYDFFLHSYLSGEKFSIVSKPTARHQRGGMSGDGVRSMAEIEEIKKNQLGWKLPFVNFIHLTYRLLKKLRPQSST